MDAWLLDDNGELAVPPPLNRTPATRTAVTASGGTP